MSCCGRCVDWERNQRPRRLQHSQQHPPPCARYVQSQMSLGIADISPGSSLAARHQARDGSPIHYVAERKPLDPGGAIRRALGAGQANVQPLDIARALRAA